MKSAERLIAVLQDLMGCQVVSLAQVSRGYTNNGRFLVTLDDGRSVFAKAAVDGATTTWLRTEHAMYEQLRGEAFVPGVFGWLDGDLPVLVIEDLSGSRWPPPWDTGMIDAVLASLDALARLPAPDWLPRFDDGEAQGEGWNQVLADPGEFLSLGLAGPEWLDQAGPILREAAGLAALRGNSILHCDVRSDNVCLTGDVALLVDWNLAQVGNPWFDVAFWLPSLAAETGLAPESVAPECPAELAAYVAGFFASRAGGPLIPHAPLVRRVQRDQLVTALPWAVRVLGLEPPH
jgi:hypothetical protein